MTGRDLVSSSLRLIGVLASGETPTAAEATDGLKAFNQMLANWRTESLMGLQAVSTSADLDEDLNVPEEYEEACRYNLALRLAPEYGKVVSADIAAIAMESKANIKRSNAPTAYLEVDAALLPQRAGFDITTGGLE